MATYSFLDVVAAIVGPGGAISIGAGAGIAEEGITVEPVEDKNIMTIGADGKGMHSLIASEASTVTVRILKTSPVNFQLNAMYIQNTISSANHGANTIAITNLTTGDAITLQQVAFKKRPAITYSKEAGMNEWTFDAIKTTTVLGIGTPVA